MGAEQGFIDALNQLRDQELASEAKAVAKATATLRARIKELEARIAEATVLLARINLHARFPLPSDDPSLYADLRAFLSRSPAQPPEPTLLERIEAEYSKWHYDDETAPTVLADIGAILRSARGAR